MQTTAKSTNIASPKVISHLLEFRQSKVEISCLSGHRVNRLTATKSMCLSHINSDQKLLDISTSQGMNCSY